MTSTAAERGHEALPREGAPVIDARAVARAFGLGEPDGPPVPVPGGRSHPLWRLRTDSGTWAVKRLNRSREAWWMAGHVVAAAVEEQAFRHGVAMPRPVAPLRPAAPLLADLPGAEGAPESFLVHAWCDGTAVPRHGEAARAVREWAGRTLALLHALPLPPGIPAVPALHRPHTPAEWREGLDSAPADVPDGFVERVRAYLPDVERAVGLVGRCIDGPSVPLTPVLTHGDVKPDNVLVCPDGPVLLDWDGAGPDRAEWEVVRAGLAFGGTRETFREVLLAYRAAGGAAVPPVAEVFAGEVDRRVGGAAWLLWRALGHRPVSPPERAAAFGHVLEYLAALRTVLRQADTWTAWLSDA